MERLNKSFSSPGQTSFTLALLLTVGMLYATGCAKVPRGMPVYHGICPAPTSADTPPDALQVQYLRTGGFLFKRGSDTIMTAPFYSNPGLLRVLFGKIACDPDRIESNLPPVHEASAILVGHAHYDHAMDLPYIANHRATNAVIYGSTTLSNILVAEVSSNRLRSIEDCAGDFARGGKPGTWTNVLERVRIMPLRSEHAPHLFCFTAFSGEVTEDRKCLPSSSWCWKEGQTLAYLIDFMAADGSIEHRILYQDTAAGSPEFGGLPRLPSSDTRKVDVLVVCLASFHNVDNYPRGVIYGTDPRNVVVGHWEDFFSDPKELKVVRGTNGKRFMKKLSKLHPPERTFLPAPAAWMVFPKTK